MGGKKRCCFCLLIFFSRIFFRPCPATPPPGGVSIQSKHSSQACFLKSRGWTFPPPGSLSEPLVGILYRDPHERESRCGGERSGAWSHTEPGIIDLRIGQPAPGTLPVDLPGGPPDLNVPVPVEKQMSRCEQVTENQPAGCDRGPVQPKSITQIVSRGEIFWGDPCVCLGNDE